jgi:hypothetical protein
MQLRCCRCAVCAPARQQAPGTTYQSLMWLLHGQDSTLRWLSRITIWCCRPRRQDEPGMCCVTAASTCRSAQAASSWHVGCVLRAAHDLIPYSGPCKSAGLSSYAVATCGCRLGRCCRAQFACRAPGAAAASASVRCGLAALQQSE